MARIPMVTRTITTTHVMALCLNIETSEPFNKSFTLARTFADDKKLLDTVKEIGDTTTEKVVAIVSKSELSTLYGMPENDFIKYAKVLPNRAKGDPEPISESKPSN